MKGNAKKFSILPLMTTIGAGFGLMGFSVLITDCILLHFTRKKELFQKLKAIDTQQEIRKHKENKNQTPRDFENLETVQN